MLYNLRVSNKSAWSCAQQPDKIRRSACICEHLCDGHLWETLVDLSFIAQSHKTSRCVVLCICGQNMAVIYSFIRNYSVGCWQQSVIIGRMGRRPNGFMLILLHPDVLRQPCCGPSVSPAVDTDIHFLCAFRAVGRMPFLTGWEGSTA